MTVIICPACNTRFETAAVIPPTGRKVRCSKCGNVWQALAVIEPAKPTVITAPLPPPVEPRPAPMAPRPAPAAPPPAAAPRPQPSEPRPGSMGAGMPMGRFPGAPSAPPAPAPGFGARPNSGALPNGEPAPAQAARTGRPSFSTDDDMQPDMGGDGSGLAGMGGDSSKPTRRRISAAITPGPWSIQMRDFRRTCPSPRAASGSSRLPWPSAGACSRSSSSCLPP